MNVVLFGATGMIGSGVLHACLRDEGVREVVAVTRRPCGQAHPKLRETLHDDFFHYEAIRPVLAGADVCFFCLGVSSVGMAVAAYRRLTYDLTLAAAAAMIEASPRVSFCYVSGAGTDSTARGRVMWARIKGLTENALLAMPFTAAWMFRPAYIQPLEGVRSRTPLYRLFYTVSSPLYPLLRRLAPGLVTDSATLGRALLRVAADGWPRRILETRDINRAGGWRS